MCVQQADECYSIKLPNEFPRKLKDGSISKIGEAKFRTTQTEDADLISKLLRYRIDKKSVNRYFKEKWY